MRKPRTKFPLRRGFRPDPVETSKHKFLDRRSYCGRRKDGSYHFILFGNDKSQWRLRILMRSKKFCEHCGLSTLSGEAHHKSSGDVNRCDCDENGCYLCTNRSWQGSALGCHEGLHPRIGGKTWKQPAFTCPGFVPKEEQG